MRIVIAHNFYQQKGGEDQVVENETALLEEKGHQAMLYSADNREIHGLISKTKTALRVSYSGDARKDFVKFLRRSRPDIVHIHNFFPLLSPSLYDACKDAGVPVVQTLHNYRITCSNGLLLREGKPCELCVVGSPYQGAVHACYRNSRIASLPVAKMVATHRRKNTWNRKVARMIALTEFAKSRFVSAGIEADRIAVKPNFVPDPRTERGTGRTDTRPTALFVGRLTPEKGLRTLLDAWRGLDIPLTVVGNGPLLEEVRDGTPEHITSLGWQTQARIASEMRKASFLVMPSEWYEGFPMVLLEAFAHGIPVIASNIGSLAELVRPDVNGVHFKVGDPQSLAKAAKELSASPDRLTRLGAGARKTYIDQYTPDENYRQLMAIYEGVLGRS